MNNITKSNTLIEREPIDVLIKYIDLSDETLKREGIPQINKNKIIIKFKSNNLIISKMIDFILCLPYLDC